MQPSAKRGKTESVTCRRTGHDTVSDERPPTVTTDPTRRHVYLPPAAATLQLLLRFNFVTCPLQTTKNLNVLTDH